MAVLVETSSSYTFSNTSDSRSVTVDADATLVLVWVGTRNQHDHATTMGITLGGNALTKLDAQNADDGGLLVEGSLWYIKSPPTGSQTLAITALAAVARATSVIVVQISGNHATTTFGTQVKGTRNNNSASLDIVLTSAAGELCVDFVVAYQGNAGTQTEGAGQTSLQKNIETGTGTADPEASSSSEAGAASVTMNWTRSTNGWWAQVGVPVKPAAAATSSGGLLLRGVG